MNRYALAGAAAIAALLAVALWLLRPTPQPGSTPSDLTYIGSDRCASCHASEDAAWRRSQHHAAMQPATAESVLGDFGGAKFTESGVTSMFFTRDAKPFVHTDGPDGKLADFEIRYTIGVAPLQQYLIELPGGRLQALGIAWDARPKESGGQRWFHLYARHRIAAGDPLHWTGIEQNWNYQCADCHATNLQKNYDAATRTYHTTRSDLGVGCEACHGPGSGHAADPSQTLPVALDERRGVVWKIEPTRGIADRSTPLTSHREVEACAQCHSRRGQFAPGGGKVFRDAYRPALLEPGLYHVDGQMRSEVYDYGSFLQSRMYARGVTCSDCHEPHSGELRAASNAPCARCHAPEKFDTPDHHHHAADSAGARCTACHMPTATYMEIDVRHDHGFRIPRPDLARVLGTPDACAACHADRPSGWTASEFRRWVPQPRGGGDAFAEEFASADYGMPDAARGLARVLGDASLPAIVRASAAQRMAHELGAATVPALDAALTDPDPLVRAAATSALAGLDAANRARALAPRLSDSDRIVRMEAARALTGEAEANLGGPDAAAFARAIDEYVAAERFNADRPDAQVNLGNLLGARGEAAGAEAAYREALALEPGFPPGAVNLADLRRVQGDEAGGEQVLREALARNGNDASLHHALGLALVRRQQKREALSELALAARLDPATARYAYVYAIALHDGGARAQALRVLEDALKRHPDDSEILAALNAYQRESPLALKR
jgi:tetratricopeptide (TPR) repeat protein